jgi:uncharacterized membrane protein YphA (DoxX/SURF4 family)
MFNAGSKLPHSLRIIIFFLRLSLGLNFFYLGFSTLFNPPLMQQLRERSLGALYDWLGPGGNAGSLATFFGWAFVVIGICLVIGLFTRFAAIAGILLVLFSYLPTFLGTTLAASQFINDQVIVVLCLLVLIFSNAGGYLGVDTFIHIHLSSKHK